MQMKYQEQNLISIISKGLGLASWYQILVHFNIVKYKYEGFQYQWNRRYC
jgi:hypothetical protein